MAQEKTTEVASVHEGKGHDAEWVGDRSEEHTSELQSQSNLVCRLLLEKKKIELKTAAIKEHHTLSTMRPDTSRHTDRVSFDLTVLGFGLDVHGLVVIPVSDSEIWFTL